ncbi:MAG TPA: DUF1848 domain-containing protein [Firmicutes bacterium]|nr:DUF1848 domain-containing protein [Bacillota bacterium]
MIVSASRRTDIPRFYSTWFMNRIRAGYCTYPNPFNRNQVVQVSLKPEDVDVIVFWTKNPRPLMQHLQELDERGYRYYFQFTVNGYPRQIEPRVPTLEECIDTFRELARRVSPQRVIWRYDPIIWAAAFDEGYHFNMFARISAALRGYTERAVISLVDDYRGAWKRMSTIEGLRPCTPESPGVASLLRRMSDCARAAGMEIVSCAEPYDLQDFGIRPGKCIDEELIQRVFGIRVSADKDTGQRQACGCILSRDIGVYGTCRHGCVYCYAAGLPGLKLEHHDPDSPSLVGRYEANPSALPVQDSPSGAPEIAPVQHQLPLLLDEPASRSCENVNRYLDEGRCELK